MKYMLDTNICIYIIKRSPESIFNRFKELTVNDVSISGITLCELQFGVSNSKKKEQNQQALNEFLAPINILEFPSAASQTYGDVRVELKSTGKIIGPLDLLIAAHALYLNLTIATNNIKEFARIPRLKLEDWT